MILHPVLRALRADDAPQRQAQYRLIEAVAYWHTQPRMAAVVAAVEGFAKGAPLADCAALAALFREGGKEAGALADEFTALLCGLLRDEPLGHVPLRHFTDGTLSTLLLARAGNVTLTLVAMDGAGLAAKPAPVTADFGPSEMWEHVLAGHAEADLVRCHPIDATMAKLDVRSAMLSPGTVIYRDAEREALQLRRVDGALVSLRLQRRRDLAAVTREYRLADGALVHQAAANPRDSRIELMLALLGRMERRDAVPHMAAIARGDGTPALRWQALRECLALDSGAGFAMLTALARSDADPLAPAAGALRAQLVETWPQLAETEPCPV